MENLTYNNSNMIIGAFFENEHLPIKHGILLSFKVTNTSDKITYELQICFNFQSKMYARIKWGQWENWISLL